MMHSLNWSQNIYRASKHHSLSLAYLACLFHGEDIDPLHGHPDSIKYYLDYFRKPHSASGENCLFAYVPDNITYDSLAEKIIQQWINSPGHRANMLEDRFNSESISSTLTNYHGQFAVFLNKALALKYYPELTQLCEVFPSLKTRFLDMDVIYFSSQNFSGMLNPE